MSILIWIMVVISVILIVVSFIMAPESKGFSGALVGSSDLDLFKVSKERGIKKILKWTMFLSGLTLMVVALLVRIYI